MKTDIHPTYFTKAKAKCACGAVHELGATLESFELDICSKCHPFYTGKQKLVDTAGRVDKFKKRMIAFETRQAEEKERLGSKTKKESVEEKMTRKAAEKEALKEAEKAEKEVAKKEEAKKKAAKTIVKAEKKTTTKHVPSKAEGKPAAKKPAAKKKTKKDEE